MIEDRERQRFRTALDEVFDSTSLSKDEPLLEKFAELARQVFEENRQQNLTRIVEPVPMAWRHFFESWSVLRDVSKFRGPVLDAGTGAGFPGLPLALCHQRQNAPDLKFVLLDARAKKVKFLDRAIKSLGLASSTRAVHGRLEEHLFDYRYGDIVTRALASVEKIAEWLIPHRRNFERLILVKGPRFDEEWEGASRARQSFELIERHDLVLPHDMGTRVLVILKPKCGSNED